MALSIESWRGDRMKIEFVARHEGDKTAGQSFGSPSGVTKHLREVSGFTEQWHITASVVVNELASLMSHDNDWPDQPGSYIYAYTGKEWLVKNWEWLWANVLSSEEGMAYHRHQ